MNRKPFLQPEENESDRRLWDLLGRARRVEAGPLFSRNVVREIRLSQPEKKPVWHGFFGRTALITAAALAILLPMAAPRFLPSAGKSDHAAMLESSAPAGEDLAQEFESIERLGELMAVSDPGTLSDEAFLDLLF